MSLTLKFIVPVAVAFGFSLLAPVANAQGLKLEKAWETDKDLTTCESVLADPNGSRYFVSCINGKPTDKDSNGFISVISPTGTIVNRYWGRGVSAPKGMGISGNSLYVSDIDHIAIFDVMNGKRTAYIMVEGAKFLNDVAVDKKGNVYVSDMETSVIHKVVGKNVTTLVAAGTFTKPNGLLARPDGLQVIDMATGKLFLTAYDGKNTVEQPLSQKIEGGDGIVNLPQTKDHFLISRWHGKIYGITGRKPSEKKPCQVELLLDTEEVKDNTADIGYDEVRNLVLVPTFFGNRVVAYKVTGGQK